MIITVNINSLVRVLLRWGKDVVVSDWRSVSRRGHQQWWYHDNHNASQATFNLLLASSAQPITAASHLSQPMGGRPSILHKWMLIIWAVIILRPDRNSNLPLQPGQLPPATKHATWWHHTPYHTVAGKPRYNQAGRERDKVYIVPRSGTCSDLNNNEPMWWWGERMGGWYKMVGTNHTTL